MTDADDLACFTEALKRLDALSERETSDGVLEAMAKEASSYVVAVVGCLIVDPAAGHGGQAPRVDQP